MGIFSALGLTATDAEKEAKRDLNNATREQQGRSGRSRGRADSSRNDLVSGINDFNPTDFMRQSAEAVGADLHEQFVDTNAQDNQNMNARGFFGSRMNSARITEDFSARLSRALAGLSMQAGGMELNRLGLQSDLHRTDEGVAGDDRLLELDLLAGRRDSEIDARNSRLQGLVGMAGAAASF